MFKENDIEINEIVYNNLPIKNLRQLSYSIFQDETLIDDKNKANDCLNYLTENLKKTYELVEYIDENVIEKVNSIELDRLRKEVDLYQIGDIINFLETIKITNQSETYEEKMQRLAKEDYFEFINHIDSNNNYFYEEIKSENDNLFTIEVFSTDGLTNEDVFIMSAEYEYNEEEDEYIYRGK